MKDVPLIWFEYDVVAHCNLNCAGCSHYSPIAEKEFVTVEKAEKELSRIGEVAGGKCKYINIMGGEPLLNPDLEQILIIARKNFPSGDIRLVTNGILLMSQSDSFWNVLRNNNISLHITEYPINIQLTQIRIYASVYGVTLRWFRNGEIFFNYALEPEGINDIDKSYTGCIMRTTPQYHDGKLYHCTPAGCVYRLNKAFNCNFEVRDGDYIDIYSNVNAADVVAFLSKPIPFCRYCKPTNWEKDKFHWHISECKRDEWIKPQ